MRIKNKMALLIILCTAQATMAQTKDSIKTTILKDVSVTGYRTVKGIGHFMDIIAVETGILFLHGLAYPIRHK